MSEKEIDVLDRLMQQIHQRAATLPPASYTTELISGGLAAMGAKILEEAGEVVDAAEHSDATQNQHLISEACDLLYHLWVLLGSRGITVADLRQELQRREGTSGLQEKQQRNNPA